MVPFVSYVSLGQSKLRLTFSHINGHYVLNFASVTSAVEQLKFLIWKWHQMNLIVFEKPLITKSWLYFSVRNVRSLLHEVKTGKKSWSMEKLASPQTSFGVRLSRIHFSPKDVCGEAMEKQAGFKLHVTLVCYAINFCKFVPFSILLRRWTVHVELSFMIYSALPMPPFFCCTFWGNFWKARKNTLVFENDLQRLFKIIIISVSLIYAVGCDTR